MSTLETAFLAFCDHHTICLAFSAGFIVGGATILVVALIARGNMGRR